MEAFKPADGQWSVKYDGMDHSFQSFQAALAHADGLAISKKLVKHIHPKERSIHLKANSNKFTINDDHSSMDGRTGRG